jgi:ATP/maltotriose-dependent transcriptional regulator MalT
MEEQMRLLEQGNEAMERGAWEEARACFRAALAQQETPEAYEGLSWSHWSLNEVEELFQTRETAFRLYRQAGDLPGAARMAMWIGTDHIDFRSDLAATNGWHQRAARLLEGLSPAPEHAWLPILEGDIAMLVENDAPRAKERARVAGKLARDLGVFDVEVMSLAMEGFALVTEGEVAAGMRLLDEAAVAALGGEMSQPGYAGWVLCYLLYACEQVRDHERAVDWCSKMREFAERSQMAGLRGICRVHFAAVLIWRGDWQAAESELADAALHLEPHHPLLAADGTVRLAELRHRQGRISESEDLFRSVEWHPLALIGLAELALEAGRPRDAQELVDRYLRQVPETARTQRAGAYELLVRAHALLGNHERAAEAMAVVQSLSSIVTTLPLRAATHFSAGALAVASHEYERARACFEDAIDLFERCCAPYEAARARLELASVLVLLDRLERAASEAATAYNALRKLSSVFYAGRAAALQQDIQRRIDSGASRTPAQGLLTDRQLDILRLISRGLNDREIAAALVVSEHTVHRHVANILQRLDLPSRAAAVAYAGNHGML